MKRILTSIGLGLATAALGAGTAVAGSPTGEYPASEGWEYTDITLAIPAGYACDGDVRLFYRGHERRVVTGPNTSTYEAGADVKATFTNVGTGRSLTKRSDGTFYETFVNGGRDLRVVAKGRNLLFGSGVRGILYTTGINKFIVTDVMDPVRSKITVYKIKGKAVDLCRKLGLRPVNGKSLPPPEAPSR